jgi:pseudouridylate synthase
MHVELAPEVALALSENRPVVALESTLITHGLPHPVNLEVARALEAEARAAGAVPATMAILDGVPHAGLSDAALEELASARGVRKCSRRDLPIALARREHGATTVAATMWLAHAAGIRVFATGGIGGVHRGQPLDQSADLIELGRTPVTVVCAGAKAILDLPLTLEVLETQGVPVIGYGTDDFPAFYTPRSGLPVDVRCDSAAEVASVVRARDALLLPAGLLVAVPVPADDALPEAVMEDAIQRALADAERAGVRGKAVTPFLLSRVSAVTGAASQRANIALLKNNVRVAAAIATALCDPEG